MIHLRRSDPTVNAIVAAAFPEYKGKKIIARVQDRVQFYGTNWDEGSKRDYSIVRLKDMHAQTIQDAPYFQGSALHAALHEIPTGVAVVVLVSFRAIESVEIIASQGSITPMLESKPDITPDERIVLIATRSLKPSYGGISNYRYHEAKRQTGITLARWEAAKESLTAHKLLNKAGAITIEGRNIVGYDSL